MREPGSHVPTLLSRFFGFGAILEPISQKYSQKCFSNLSFGARLPVTSSNFIRYEVNSIILILMGRNVVPNVLSKQFLEHEMVAKQEADWGKDGNRACLISRAWNSQGASYLLLWIYMHWFEDRKCIRPIITNIRQLYLSWKYSVPQISIERILQLVEQALITYILFW